MTTSLRLAGFVMSAGLAFGAAALVAAEVEAAPAAPVPSAAGAMTVGEKVPTELAGIQDFHSLGVIQGRVNIFRSASPVRDLVKNASAGIDPAAVREAEARLQRIADLGVKTIIDLENPDPASIKTNTPESVATKLAWLALERQAAAKAGITVLYHPVENKGDDSIKTMPVADVHKLLESVTDEVLLHAKAGGVLFHCSAGHDRTGITAAYLRMKYQHWPVEEAILEMRRLGHNWPKYSSNGGLSSWDEDHLRAIAAGMAK